jgi:predicted lactoylglutathione lyase
MDRMIVVNLPVKDLAATRRFYTGVGFGVDETFSDEHCLCVAVSPTIYVMALDHERFADFVSTPIADPRETTQVISCLSMATREETDAFVAAALAHGGARHTYPVAQGQMTGPDGEEMYGAAVTDPDGHIWELLYTAPAAA